jgi:hypothetical protein
VKVTPVATPAAEQVTPDPATSESIPVTGARDLHQPLHAVEYSYLIGARINPLGLVDDFEIGYRLRLIDRPGALYEHSALRIKARFFVTPTSISASPRIEIQPLSIFRLAAEYSVSGYFGVLNSILSFPSPTADHRDRTRNELAAAGKNYPTYSTQLSLSALAQVLVGPVGLRNNVAFLHTHMRVRNGDRVYYDQPLDIMVPNRGWVVTNDLDALYLTRYRLVFAARYTLTHAFYRPHHFAPTEDPRNVNSPTHRVGPAVLYTFYDDPKRRFNRPTMFALAQFWVRHRYRTGAEVEPAIPYFVVGFAFDGRLWSSD